jgi:hypothetical protein
MKYFFALLPLLMFFVGCDKDRPRKGLYWGEFYATDSLGSSYVRYDHSINISDPSESALTINGSVLGKKGKTINGQMGFTKAFNNSDGLVLSGKWRVKNGYYIIDGDFNTTGPTAIVFGTFRMGSY